MAGLNLQGILFQDSTGFLLNPDVFLQAAECMRARFERSALEYFDLHPVTNSQKYALKIKRLVVWGATKHIMPQEYEEILPTLPDSMNILSIATDIYRLIPVLAQNRLLDSTLFKSILVHSDFEYTSYFLNLLVPGDILSGKILKGKFVEPNLQTLSELSNPVLPPLMLLTDARYKYRHGEQIAASDEVNLFWYHSGTNYPPQYWWFDNYPAYLIRCYTIGHLDGGRLPLWLNDLHEVIDGDPLLYELLELAKYYNLNLFDVRNNFDAQNGVN